MDICCEGHSFAYEMNCLAMLFYPGEKMNECSTGDMGPFCLLTRRTVEGDRAHLYAEVRRDRVVLSDEIALPLSTPDYEIGRAHV